MLKPGSSYNKVLKASKALLSKKAFKKLIINAARSIDLPNKVHKAHTNGFMSQLFIFKIYFF